MDIKEVAEELFHLHGSYVSISLSLSPDPSPKYFLLITIYIDSILPHVFFHTMEEVEMWLEEHKKRREILFRGYPV